MKTLYKYFCAIIIFLGECAYKVGRHFHLLDTQTYIDYADKLNELSIRYY